MLPPRRLVVVSATLSLVVLAGVLAHWVLHGPVTASTLVASLNRSTDTGSFTDSDRCRRTGPDRWHCVVLEYDASDGSEYDVRVNSGTSCWTARRRMKSPYTLRTPRVAASCVRLWE